MATVFIIYFWCLVAVYFATLWKIFEKAGYPAWAGFVPIYNLYIWLKIIERPWWWIFILCIPGINIPLLLGVMNVTTVRYFGIYSLSQTLIAIFLPHYAFYKLAYDGQQQLVGPMDWSKQDQREERKLSDHAVLIIVSFGIGEILIAVFKLFGSKDKPNQKTMVKDWADAIVFALIAASMIRTYVFEAYQIPTSSMEKTLEIGDFLFVNKIAYGSRVPNTPLSYPLVHNTFPLVNTKSYVQWWKIDYRRLPGYSDINRNDVIVFNFPAGDTAIFDPGVKGLMGHDYHAQLRNRAFQTFANVNGKMLSKASIEEIHQKVKSYYPQARDYYENQYGLVYRPVDKRENYIKRCVAVAGDTLEIIDHELFINGDLAYKPDGLQFGYSVKGSSVRGLRSSEKQLRQNLDVEAGQINVDRYSKMTSVPLNDENFKKFKQRFGKKNVKKYDRPKGLHTNNEKHWSRSQTLTATGSYLPVFPNDPGFDWTKDNFGPLWIPEAGKTIDLTLENLPLYKRVIRAYEGHDLKVKEGAIYIDGQQTNEYTFDLNYYWCMGDNRDRSADCRMWGFVPEDHIVGQASFIFFSRNPRMSFFEGIRWDKIFSGIE